LLVDLAQGRVEEWAHQFSQSIIQKHSWRVQLPVVVLAIVSHGCCTLCCRASPFQHIKPVAPLKRRCESRPLDAVEIPQEIYFLAMTKADGFNGPSKGTHGKGLEDPSARSNNGCLAIDSRALLPLVPLCSDDAHSIHAADRDRLSWQGHWRDTVPSSLIERFTPEIGLALIAQIEIPTASRACPVLLLEPFHLGRPGQRTRGIDNAAMDLAVSTSWALICRLALLEESSERK
jgi:hypothetical protein